MPNKFPKFFDKHKICIICEGNEEYEYFKRLKDLKVWNEQYDISLVNAGGNGNIPARYQDRYQNGAAELVLVFCDTEKKPHEQYEDIKRKINEFHDVDNAADEVNSISSIKGYIMNKVNMIKQNLEFMGRTWMNCRHFHKSCISPRYLL